MNSNQFHWRFIDAADYNMLAFFFAVEGGHSPRDLFNLYLMGGEL